MKVLELRGLKSQDAFYSFHKIMIGLTMTPRYYGEDYFKILDRISEMEESEQDQVLRYASVLVNLNPEEVMSMLRFCTDANGVPYSIENVKNLTPAQITEGIFLVSKEMAKIRIFSVNESEKKNLVPSV